MTHSAVRRCARCHDTGFTKVRAGSVSKRVPCDHQIIPAVYSLHAIFAMGSQSVNDVLAERAAQIDKHGYTLEHDLDHHPVDLALSAAAYLNTAVDQLHGKEHPASAVPEEWPFCGGWKPGDVRRNLVKALALGLATLDRLDNAPRDSGEAPHEVAALELAEARRADHLDRRERA